MAPSTPVFVALSELTNDPNASADDIVKKGDEINVSVLRVNDQEAPSS